MQSSDRSSQPKKAVGMPFNNHIIIIQITNKKHIINKYKA